MGARGILHDGNWRLSCSATAAWIKAGWPPSLPSPSGGRRESQRGRGSPLPPRFPPPLGEGEGGGRQKRKKLPHPCPLPQAGEGVHTKFIAASACCMGARGIFHDENWWLSCSAAGVMPQGWLAPIPAFPQRGKERRPEGTEQRWAGGRSTLTLTLSRKREREKAFPPPAGVGKGWWTTRCIPHYLPDHRLCVLPLPLVGEGRGEGGGQPGICYFTCSYSGPCTAPIPAKARGRKQYPHPDPLP